MDQKDEHDHNDGDDEQYTFHAHVKLNFSVPLGDGRACIQKGNQGTSGSSNSDDHTGGQSGQSSLGGEFQHSRRGTTSPADTGAYAAAAALMFSFSASSITSEF
jgi:hypothetical protein